MTKTLRVDLADLEGIPHASGPSGTSVVVTAEYTSPVVLEADGKIILAPKSKTMGSAGRVDFTGIYTSDSEEVREDHRGFAVRVKVEIREPNGGTRTWSRTVKPLEHMADTIRLGRMPSAEGLPPQWVTVDEILSDLTELIDGKVDAARWLTGTGRPEGSVAAPVGTRYTDTNATAGAIEWIKASGSGSSGWEVAHGDTGWRDINAFVSSTFTISTGQVLIRRTGNLVTLRVRNLSFNSALSGAHILPTTGGFNVSGFRPEHAARLPFRANQTNAIPDVMHMSAWMIAGNLVLTWYGKTTTNATSGANVVTLPSGTAMTGQLSFVTDEAWPSTLPGAPA